MIEKSIRSIMVAFVALAGLTRAINAASAGL